jgi:hypothetical protein
VKATVATKTKLRRFEQTGKGFVESDED